MQSSRPDDHTLNSLEQFQVYWARFSLEIALEATLSQRLYSILVQAYTEPQRRYHTVEHIVECLALFYEIESVLDDQIAVQTAIWFHDVIYDPKASDNEARSAELMLEYCSGVFDDEKLNKIASWIGATQHHLPSQDQDLNYLLDIDLAILGSPPARFAEYERQIRFEYAWVDHKIYQVKRAEVLGQFYQMQLLFQTAYFQDRFEQQAKSNLLSVI